MKKSFLQSSWSLSFWRGRAPIESATIGFILTALCLGFALTACDDSSSASSDETGVSSSSVESPDSSVTLSGASAESNGSSDENMEKDKSSSSENKSSSSTKETKNSSDSKSSSSVKSGDSSSSTEAPKSYAEAKVMPSGTYACSKYKCFTTEYLNQDFLETGKYGEILDERDGQVYKTIEICDEENENCQIWMAQNLNYAYTGIKFNFSGGKSDSTSWCYKNDLDNCGIYGRLYTWSAAMDSAGLVSDANKIGCGFGVPCIPNNPHRGICPVGWHLPDTTELTVLLNYAGGGIVAQNVLKSKSGWNGTDDLGFSLLPAGTGVYSYLFDHLKQYTEIWSVTEADGDHDERAWILKIDYSDLQRSLFNNKKSYHLSVRCVKDSK